MSVTHTARPRLLYFITYLSHEVPPWLAARITWDFDAYGAKLELNEDLSMRDQLRAIAWSSAVLPGYLQADADGFAVSPNTIGPVLPMRELDRYGRAIHLRECSICEYEFDRDRSNRVDICQYCSEAPA